MKHLLIFILLLGLFAVQTHAAMILTLNDGSGNTALVQDTDHDGVLNYNGNLGGSSNWIVNVSTGLSKPLLGSSTEAYMDLNTVNVTSSGGGTLTIKLTDIDFALPAGSYQLTSAIGGTTNGSVQVTQILDPDNSLFATVDPSNDVSL